MLCGASYTFEQGKIYGLLGRNGAGKTTFFNCLNEDLTLDGGSFVLEEDGRRRPMSCDDIGYVLSTPVVPDFLTAREFLRFFLDINKGKIQNPMGVDDYIDSVQIAPDDRQKLLRDFSHGMKNNRKASAHQTL